MYQQINKESLHAMVDGRVQGVGFRYFVVTQARQINLVGWVRNTHQGQVEVHAEGTRQQLDELLAKLRQGPPSSFVLDVKFDFQPATNQFNNFDVRSTI